MSLCFDKICRTCMAESSAMLSIFDKGSAKEIYTSVGSANEDYPITGLLKSFTNISASQNNS